MSTSHQILHSSTILWELLRISPDGFFGSLSSTGLSSLAGALAAENNHAHEISNYGFTA